MYAQRFTDGPRFRPGSMAAAVATNGGVLAALLLAAPEILPTLDPPSPPIFDVPLPKPDPKPSVDTKRPLPRPTTAATSTPVTTEQPATTIDLGLAPADGERTGGSGPVGETWVDPVVPARPALIGARFDPRYARDQEPPYPDTLRDAGIEGVVKLRLTIGANGRVEQAVPLVGNAQLLRVAIRHVLAKWRFLPATRGAVPEESTQVMTVRFRLDS